MQSRARTASVPESGAAPMLGGDGRYRLTFGFSCCPGVRGEFLILFFFVLAALVLTWPMVATLGQATGTRGDYLDNLWNGWWLKHSLVQGHSPFWTDYLYFPDGISLRRHTLSPLNALFLAGSTSVLGPHQAFSLLVLAHFALSGWCFSLLARYVTGSTAGGVLGGLVYSFCPFHYFYLCQINVFSFESMPLALLFFLRHAREGGRRNLAGVVLALAGMAATIEYYVVYTYLALVVLALSAWLLALSPGGIAEATSSIKGLGAVQRIAEVRASKVKTIVLGGSAGERRLDRRNGVWTLSGEHGGIGFGEPERAREGVACELREDLGDALAGVLTGGDGDEFGMRMAEQPSDEFFAGVTGRADDGEAFTALHFQIDALEHRHILLADGESLAQIAAGNHDLSPQSSALSPLVTHISAPPPVWSATRDSSDTASPAG